MNCFKLENITIPEGVNDIKRRIFYKCRNLKNIVIPPNVKFIRDGAFEECRALVHVTMSEDVTYIDNATFKGCEALEGVCFTWIDNVLKDNGTNPKIIHEIEQKLNREKITSLFGGNFEEYTKKVLAWAEKDFIPTYTVFSKIPQELIECFEPKIWFKLIKESGLKIDDETKIGLLELSYAFGIFDKNKVELRGEVKTISSITDDERKNGVFEDSQKRLRRVLDLFHSR